jgi:hypothetical protein
LYLVIVVEVVYSRAARKLILVRLFVRLPVFFSSHHTVLLLLLLLKLVL